MVKNKIYEIFWVESLLRLTAQEQAQASAGAFAQTSKAEKAFEVTTNCANFVHKANYIGKET